MASIADIQARLNSLGASPPLTVDGVSGPMTQNAIKAFQQSKGLSVDGVVGPQTLAAMGLSDASSSSSSSGIKPAVLAALQPIFAQWEGSALPYMYTDSKGYVTTGTGNKIDPISLALALPWKNQDGSLATQSDVTVAWNTVKNAFPGTQSTASQGLTSIRLDHDGLNQLMTNTANSFYSYLRTKYPNFDSWPADAQLAVLSISWAWGPGFASVWGPLGQQFNDAINRNDFVAAAGIMRQASAHEESINPGIIPRNIGTVAMLQNAANVLKSGGDLAKLFYPAVAPLVVAAAGLGGFLFAIASGVGGYFLGKRFGLF